MRLQIVTPDKAVLDQEVEDRGVDHLGQRVTALCGHLP